ncbi:MAG: phosphotransferase [Acidimicrobiia bacterium]|nr:phosphotransferase [Acidimicrobiia bacterium]
MISTDALTPNLGDFLARQRWYGGLEAPSVLEVLRAEVLKESWPALIGLIIEADGATYQVLVGLRPHDDHAEFFRGHDDGILGDVTTERGPALAYEATIDPELGLAVLDWVTDGREVAERVRPVGGEQSNTSLVYDDHLILKLFRRLQPGPNPEVEVTERLSALGFDHVAPPLASTSYDGTHLAVVQPYLLGGTEGWAMAMTSLRDLFGVHDTQPMPILDPNAPPPPSDPAEAGGDFSGEAERLGVVTATMHKAMAEAFGERPGDPAGWADSISSQAAALPPGDLDPTTARGVLDDLRHLTDAGKSIRVHGDYHLGQVMRTDAGWFVLDFEGEPLRSVEERRRPTSPLRDVAGMLRSFHYASMSGLADRSDVDVAEAWELRNRRAFLDGYLGKAGAGGIIPADETSVNVVLSAFELEKAVYEIGYEKAHRPNWIGIPRAALRRLNQSRITGRGAEETPLPERFAP